MTPAERIAAALFEHQGWKHDGAPDDECDCCATTVLKALDEAGWMVVRRPLTSTTSTVTYSSLVCLSCGGIGCSTCHGTGWS